MGQKTAIDPGTFIISLLIKAFNGDIIQRPVIIEVLGAASDIDEKLDEFDDDSGESQDEDPESEIDDVEEGESEEDRIIDPNDLKENEFLDRDDSEEEDDKEME